MRVLLALAFVIVASVSAVTYREMMLESRPKPTPPVVDTIRVGPVVTELPVAARVVQGGTWLSTDSLAAIDSIVGTYMYALQENAGHTGAMRDLALLYMKHGWFDRAVGPLARARELDEASGELRRLLELAIARSGGIADLTLAVSQFLEAVDMWGHGC
jgi:hypothetical protein